MENPGKKEELAIPIYDTKSHELYFAEKVLHGTGPSTASMVSMKYMSLFLLTLQNAGLSILMRLVRTQKHLFLSSTAVLMSEIGKFIISCLISWFIDEKSFGKFLLAIKTCIVDQPIETLKVSIPSLIYLVQNNLLYIGATHLDAATCQVTYQLKILTTALFSILLLKRRLNSYQWVSLLTLFLGVALVQIAQMTADPPANSNHVQRPLVGFLAIVVACCLSGFAGVYFELLLKSSDITVWMRNIQLCVTSIPFGFFSVYVTSHSEVSEKGFFYGYNHLVWVVIIFQTIGGLIVAVVVKFADNILKGFATSLAIVISCVLSVYIFDFQLSLNFVLGASLVMGSIFMYSKAPPQEVHKK